jgi:hypothetical protein
VKEIEDLTRRKLVVQKIKGIEDYSQPQFAIAKILRDAERGAVAPDAFLLNVKQSDGKPLPTEEFFADNFECLQKMGGYCNQIAR